MRTPKFPVTPEEKYITTVFKDRPCWLSISEDGVLFVTENFSYKRGSPDLTKMFRYDPAQEIVCLPSGELCVTKDGEPLKEELVSILPFSDTGPFKVKTSHSTNQLLFLPSREEGLAVLQIDSASRPFAATLFPHTLGAGTSFITSPLLAPFVQGRTISFYISRDGSLTLKTRTFAIAAAGEVAGSVIVAPRFEVSGRFLTIKFPLQEYRVRLKEQEVIKSINRRLK